MNRIYKLVWNKVKGCYVVASELAKNRTKGACGTRTRSAALAKGISLALALSLGAGALTAPAITYALPQGGVADSNVAINTSGNQMDITSSVRNNVINWNSFDIAKGEMVRFDNGAFTNNYLNLINSANPSAIDGMLKGGNKVFLVNPNGVIFGADSVVNVGNLVVSTVPLDKVNSEEFFASNGNIPWDKATGDVINKGKLQADTVYINGKNIRIENSANIQARDGVTQLRGEDKVELDASKGIEIWHPWGEDYGSLGWYQQSMTNATSNATLVKNASEFRTMSKTGSYIQECDITDFGNNIYSGGCFQGSYDGNGHKIYGVNITGPGLFSTISGTVTNVYLINPQIRVNNGSAGGIVGTCEVGSVVTGRVEGGNIMGKNAGGLVGESSRLATVSGTVYGLTVGSNTDGGSVGGLVGKIEDTTVQGIVDGNTKIETIFDSAVGGLVGTVLGGLGGNNISGICNAAIKVNSSNGSGVGGLVGKVNVYPGINVNIKGIFSGSITGGDTKYTGYLLGKYDGGKVNLSGIANNSRLTGTKTDVTPHQWTLPGGLAISNTSGILANASIYGSSYLGWSVSTDANSSANWRLYEGYTGGQPIFVRGTLKKLDTPLDAWKVSGTYTGSKVTIPASGAVYKALTSPEADAGTYNILSGVYSSEYDAWGQITINPMPLYLKKNGTEITKVYDGTTATSDGLYAYFELTDENGNEYTSGVVVDQGVTLNSDLKGEYADKDAATGKAVSFTSDGSTPFFSGGTGFKASNYTFQKLASDTGYTIDGSSIKLANGKITPRDIYLTRNSTEITKEYDGNTEVKQGFSNLYDVTGDATTQSLIASEGIKGNDSVKGVYSKSATATEGYLDKDVESADKIVTFTEDENKFITGTDPEFKLSNYTVKMEETGNEVDKEIETTGKITPKDLVVTVQMEQSADGPTVKGFNAQGWVAGEETSDNFTTKEDPADGGRTKVTAVKKDSFDAVYKQNYNVSSTDTYINSNKSYTQYSADGKKVVTVNTDNTEISYTDTGSGKNIEVKKPDGTPSKQIELAGEPTINYDGSMSTTNGGTDTTVFVDGGMQIKKGDSTIDIDKDSEKITVKDKDVIIFEGEMDTVPKVDVDGNVDVLKDGVTTTYQPGGDVVVCKGGETTTQVKPNGTVVVFQPGGTEELIEFTPGGGSHPTIGKGGEVIVQLDDGGTVTAIAKPDNTFTVDEGNGTQINVGTGTATVTKKGEGGETVTTAEVALPDGAKPTVLPNGTVTCGGGSNPTMTFAPGGTVAIEKNGRKTEIDDNGGIFVYGDGGGIITEGHADTVPKVDGDGNVEMVNNDGSKKTTIGMDGNVTVKDGDETVIETVANKITLHNADGTTRELATTGNTKVDGSGNVTANLKKDTESIVTATVTTDRSVIINDAAAGNTTITVAPGNDKLTIAKDGKTTVVANLPCAPDVDAYGNVKYPLDGVDGTTTINHDGSVVTERTVTDGKTTITMANDGKRIHMEKTSTPVTVDVVIGNDEVATISAADGSITTQKSGGSFTIDTNGTVLSKNDEKGTSMTVNMEENKVSVDKDGSPIAFAALNGDAVITSDRTEVTSFDKKIKTVFAMDGSVTAVNQQEKTEINVNAADKKISVQRDGRDVANVCIGGTGRANVDTANGSMTIDMPDGKTVISSDGSVYVLNNATGNTVAVDSKTKEIKVVSGQTGENLIKVGTSKPPMITESGMATIVNSNSILNVYPVGRAEIIGPDGFVVNKMSADGKIELLYPDGSLKNTILIPEGVNPSITDDGTIVIANANGTTGVKVDGGIDVYNEQYKSTTTISPDGKNIFVNYRGRNITYFVQKGSQMPTVDESGKVSYLMAGGSVTVVYPDGTKVTYAPSGEVIPEGNIEQVIVATEKTPELTRDKIKEINVFDSTDTVAVEHTDAIDSENLKTWEKVGPDVYKKIKAENTGDSDNREEDETE